MSWWIWLLIVLAVIILLVAIGGLIYYLTRPKTENKVEIYDIPTTGLLDEFRSSPAVIPRNDFYSVPTLNGVAVRNGISPMILPTSFNRTMVL